MGFYAVSDGALVGEKDKFSHQLHEELTKFGQSRKLVLIGDINPRIGREDHNKSRGKYEEDTVNKNEGFLELCNQNEITISNENFPHKLIHKYIWIQETKNHLELITR